jgi:hypothetical protein
MRPRIHAVVAALALALGAAGCGDGGSDHEQPSETPEELLRQAVANPATSGEAQIDVDATLEGGSLLAGATGAEMEGPFALDEAGGLPSFDFELDAEVAGFGVDGEVVSTGEDAFVVFFGENYRVGAARVAQLERGLLAARDEGGPPSLALAVDKWFTDPRYGGSEEVAGTETERIEGTLNSQAAAQDLTGLMAALGAPPLIRELAAGAGDGPVEAWVAYDDKTIRRLRAQFPFTVPPARQEAAGGISGGAVTLDAEISDVGADVTIEPPEGGGFQPIEQLIQRLQSLAGLAF